MKLRRVRIENFQSFGPEVTQIELDDVTFLIGPNGAGKTAMLEALSRMFDVFPNARRIRRSDFHVPLHEEETDAEERTLSIEAEFEFSELEEGEGQHFAIPPNFAHMRLENEEGPAIVRFRLDATLDAGDDIAEEFNYVLQVDEDGEPKTKAIVSRPDRNAIHVHYLPARRDPADHISYTASSLIGRLLRAGDWSSEKKKIGEFSEKISECLKLNECVDSLSGGIGAVWEKLHRGQFFTDPEISFVSGELETVLRHLSLSFGPAHGEERVEFSRLSDGQKSLLYLTLVLACHKIGNDVLGGEDSSFDIKKLKPGIFTLVAMEEPENSLSPHYLGRVTQRLAEFSEGENAQAILATHSPSMLKRVEPETIRYFRLDDERETEVTSIIMPSDDEDGYKFVREAVLAFPELYFSRLVILGEGDSEEIVIPRVMTAKGAEVDESAVSVVPLGGRHVNHFWRLLHGLGIPHVTLLDFDLGRHEGGWGRIRYAAKQLLLFNPNIKGQTQATINGLHKWDVVPTTATGAHMTDWIKFLETHGIFFSFPLDLDFSMIESYPAAYGIDGADLAAPTQDEIKAVLGKSFKHADQYSDEQQELFRSYHSLFKLGSKPAAHLEALSKLDNEELLENLPPVLDRLVDAVVTKLEDIPE